MRPSGGGEQQEGGAGAADRPSAWVQFAEHLVAVGMLAADEIEALKREGQESHESLPELLLRRERCEAPRLREELANFFGVEVVTAEDMPLDPALMRVFPGDLLVRLKCVPLTLVGTTLRMGMVDPSDQEALSTLRGLLPMSIWPVAALERDVRAALERAGAGGSGADTGETAYSDPVQRAGEAIAAGRPEEALELLAEVVQGEPASGTDGGRRLSFTSVEEQHAYADEHPDAEVDWIDPAFGFARYLRGVALGDLERLDEAARELELAVEWNPVSDRAHLELGWVEAQRGRLEPAIAAYARAAELYEAGSRDLGAQAHRSRGYCLAALGRRDEALAAYRRSLALDAKNELARFAVAELTDADEPPLGPAADDVARLAAATASGALAWESADVDGPDHRGFSCREGGRTVTVSRQGKRYRLTVREDAAVGGGERAAARVEEEQDGLLKRSRRLKPLYGVVARRTRVLER